MWVFRIISRLKSGVKGLRSALTSVLNISLSTVCSPNQLANPVCVCAVAHRGFGSGETGKQVDEVAIHHGNCPSFRNCNFPFFTSVAPTAGPLIMSRIHTNCFPYLVSSSSGSTSFWLCSAVVYGSGCGQRWASFHVSNCAPREYKNSSKTAAVERLLFSNREWKPDFRCAFQELPCFISVKWRPMTSATFKS